MDFRQYDTLKDQCEIYKKRVISAILDMKNLKEYTPNILHSDVYSCSKTEVFYNIVVQEEGRYFEGAVYVDDVDNYFREKGWL